MSEDVDASDPKEKAAETWKEILDGTHVIGSAGEVAEIISKLTPYAEYLEGFGETIGVVGDLAMIIQIGWLVLDASKEAVNENGNAGVCYGVVCGALGAPNPGPPEVGFPATPDEIAECHAKFLEGLVTGHAKVSDPKIRNRVMLSVGKNGAEDVLNGLWKAIANSPQAHHLRLTWPSAGFTVG